MPSKQIAALPVRWNDKGALRVLLITSRESGRWVMPKGWKMKGKTSWEAAEIEAMEEAGVVGTILSERVGTYRYDKRLTKKSSIKVDVALYPLLVEKLKKRWPERAERKRKWFSAKGAAKAVEEPELRKILEKLAKKRNLQKTLSP